MKTGGILFEDVVINISSFELWWKLTVFFIQL
jgi:hypothetical protein